MSKKANQMKRRSKAVIKKKNTFKKYGKNTTRGLRIKQNMLDKKEAKYIKNNEKNNPNRQKSK